MGAYGWAQIIAGGVCIGYFISFLIKFFEVCDSVEKLQKKVIETGEKIEAIRNKLEEIIK